MSDVDPALERAIVKAISLDPRNRPASVLDLSHSLSSPVNTAIVSRDVGGGALAAAVVALALFFAPRAGGTLTEQDTIILADFQNTTGEPVFDGALKVALAVALEQSPFLKVYPDDRVRETLRLMQRPTDERLTREIAREIARREQLKALVAGSIASLGTHYVLALEAIDAESGEVLAREQVEVPAKEQVLALLGSTTSKLREKLGESLSLIQRFDAPLAQATTGSLDALHAYSLALDQGRMNPRLEALPHLHRAIELDPNFAMALALLSGVYANNGRSAEAPAYSRKGVRAARQSQRAGTIFHFVALLHRRRAGVGQGAGFGTLVDQDVSARGVCLQQPRHSIRRVRAARAGDRGPPGGYASGLKVCSARGPISQAR